MINLCALWHGFNRQKTRTVIRRLRTEILRFNRESKLTKNGAEIIEKFTVGPRGRSHHRSLTLIRHWLRRNNRPLVSRVNQMSIKFILMIKCDPDLLRLTDLVFISLLFFLSVVSFLTSKYNWTMLTKVTFMINDIIALTAPPPLWSLVSPSRSAGQLTSDWLIVMSGPLPVDRRGDDIGWRDVTDGASSEKREPSTVTLIQCMTSSSCWSRDSVPRWLSEQMIRWAYVTLMTTVDQLVPLLLVHVTAVARRWSLNDCLLLLKTGSCPNLSSVLNVKSGIRRRRGTIFSNPRSSKIAFIRWDILILIFDRLTYHCYVRLTHSPSQCGCLLATLVDTQHGISK